MAAVSPTRHLHQHRRSFFCENFSSYNEGDPLSGDWTKLDGTTPAGCLVQESAKAMYLDATNDMAVYNTSAAVNWDNYSLSFRFKPTGTAPSFCVFVRTHPGAENARAYYQLVFDNDGQLKLYKNRDDQNSIGPLGLSTPISFSAGDYYPVKIVVNGANIKVYFNNETNPCIDYADDGSQGSVLTTGTFGFWRATGGGLYIDDIVVTEL